MFKKIAFRLIIGFFPFIIFACCKEQSQEKLYNFDFEQTPHITGFPLGWKTEFNSKESAKFEIMTDYCIKHTGKASARIYSDLYYINQHQALKQVIPVDKDAYGKKLTLKACLKLERVDKSGLVFQTEDADGNPLDWDTLMYNWGIRHTRDWKEYEVHLPVSPKAKTIVLGFYLLGGGTIWADDFHLLMDGKPYLFKSDE